MTDAPRRRASILGWALVALQFVALGVLAREAVQARRGGPLAYAGGAGLGVAGLLVIAAASRQLGRLLRAHPEPPTGAVLRTDGAYRLVRHPIYSGLLLIGTGAALAARTSRAIAAWVALVVVLRVKVGVEERLLTERFEGYPAYARHTPRFVPRVRR